jgi:hypothetical protein
VPGFGGFSNVAEQLTSLNADRRVTKQGVYMWWRRREITGFPEKHCVTMPNGTQQQLFKLEETEEWFERYQSRKSDRARRVDEFIQKTRDDEMSEHDDQI